MWQVRIMLKYLILKDEKVTFCLDLCDFIYAVFCIFWCALELVLVFLALFFSFKCLVLIYKLKIVRAQIAISGNVRAKAAATEFQRCHQNINVDSFILFKLS